MAVFGGVALPLVPKRTEPTSMPIFEQPPAPAPQGMADYRTIYDYNVEDTNGKIVSLKDFEKYRVILVVNTASRSAHAACGHSFAVSAGLFAFTWIAPPIVI